MTVNAGKIIKKINSKLTFYTNFPIMLHHPNVKFVLPPGGFFTRTEVFYCGIDGF